MAGNACNGSVQLCAVRVAILDDSGVPDPGATNLYVTDQIAMLNITPEISAGEEIEEKNGCGQVTVSYRTCDQEKWWNMSLTLLVPDPELTEMLSGSSLLTLGGATVGAKARPLRSATCPDDVSLELWTRRVADGVQAADFPWWRWVLPRVRNLRIDQDINFGNEALTLGFTGEAHSNSNWFDGPLNDIATLTDDSVDEAWNYMQDVAIPDAACGYAELVAS